ncbi:hypothetical protein [Methanosarcina acetivorans]|uniref:hypothetical protein n=1 Tax=Methanosarcina acetivorans TaxID=2214 RepID=UPI001D03BF44|nr:hypothetical protein [Methanosarcina acetivorans]
MRIRKVEIERLSVTSSKPFELVVTALEEAIGHPDMVEFVKATQSVRTFAELESTVHRGSRQDEDGDVHETRSRRNSA